jgi:hypothetical protein
MLFRFCSSVSVRTALHASEIISSQIALWTSTSYSHLTKWKRCFFACVFRISGANPMLKPPPVGQYPRAFTVNGHIAPASPEATGVIAGKPAAVLMIPTHTTYGDLEKLCFPEIARVWPKATECVTAFMSCTGADAWTKASSINKARVRSATVGFYHPTPTKELGIYSATGLSRPAIHALMKSLNTCGRLMPRLVSENSAQF